MALTMRGRTRVADQTVVGALPEQARVEAVVSVGMMVRDIDPSVEFYCKVHTFEKVTDGALP
jgi:hypothetical protein